MKRILFLSISGELGGAERSLLNLMTTLHQADPSAERYLIAATDGPLLAEARKLGVQTELVPLPRQILEMGDSLFAGKNPIAAGFALGVAGMQALPLQHRYVNRLRRIVAEIEPSIIHSNGFKTHILTWLLGMHQVPVVWHMRDFISHRPLVPRLLSLAASRVSVIIGISDAVARDVRNALPKVPVQRIYNGIDLGNFVPGDGDGYVLDEMANMPPAPPGVVRVGIIAAYAKWKGQDIFLKAAALVKRSVNVPVRFYIIGGPIYKTRGSQFSQNDLRAIAEQLGLHADVGFIGFQKQTAPLYRALDIVVHASTQPEPFGLTIAEAMACGRPTIVSDAGGAAELFTDGHDALGFQPGNAESLADRMRRLLVSPQLRLALARNARETAVQQYDRQRVGREVNELFDKILAAAIVPRKKRSVVRPRAADLPGGGLRLLFISPVGEMGGGERNLLDILTELRTQRPDAQLHLMTFAEGAFPEAARRLGIDVEVQPIPDSLATIGDSAMRSYGRFIAMCRLSLWTLRVLPTLLRFSNLLKHRIRQIAPNVIHTNGLKTHLIMRLVGTGKTPIVWHMHDFTGSRPMVPYLLRLTSSRASAVLAISDAVAQDTKRVLPNLPVHRVYNGIDLAGFSPGAGSPHHLDELAGLPPAAPGTLRVGMIATYARWKGQDVFLKAAAEILQQRRDVRFYIIGGPIYKTRGSQYTQDELRAIAQQLGISERVGFIGFQRQTAPMYRSLDVVVHASTHPEPFGLTIAESMACGRPTIVSAAGGAAELFTDGIDAIGFNADRKGRSLAEAITMLLCDASLRERLGQAARLTAVKRYSRERQAGEVFSVLSGLMASPSSVGSPAPVEAMPRPRVAAPDAVAHVTYISPIGDLGGAERNLLDIMAVLRERQPEMKLSLVAFDEGAFPEAARQLGVDVRILKMPDKLAALGDAALARINKATAITIALRHLLPATPTLLRFARELRTVIRDLDPTIVHTSGIKSHLLARLARLHDRPVAWLVQDFIGMRPLTPKLLRWAAGNCSGAVAISGAVSQDLHDFSPTLPVHVIYSAINTDYFVPAGATPRLDLDALAGMPPAPPGTLRIGLVATFARWKGQDVFLEAAARLLKQAPTAQVRFFIIGGPIYKTLNSQFSVEELRGLAAQLGVSDHVGFVPFQHDVAQVFAALDVMVHASIEPEPFGRTIVEGMAAGCAVVVAQSGGAAELFTHRHDAFGVTPNNVQALATALHTIVFEPGLRTRLGEEARRSAVTRFSRKRLAGELLTFYRETIRYWRDEAGNS